MRGLLGSVLPGARQILCPQADAGIAEMTMAGERRLRLSQDDVDLIVAALRSRAAMTRGLRRHRIDRLAERLADGRKGNPKFRLGEDSQTHEEDLDVDDE